MSKNKPRLQVLLATYNGAVYIRQQLDSLMEQTFGDFQVLARDDGSTDATCDILDEYAAKYPGKFVRIEDDEKCLGACRNFGRLLEASDANYVMFCDQDDLWLKDKIAKTLDLMQKTEAESPGKPVLVFTDLIVVDSSLEPMAPSFWKYEKLDPAWTLDPLKIAVQNVVTGCTMMLNAKGREAVLPIPAEAVMHDWWIALKLSRSGVIAALPEGTLLYRQHKRNDIGAKQVDSVYFAKKLTRGKSVFRDFRRALSMVKIAEPGFGTLKLIFAKLNMIRIRAFKKF